LITIDSKCYSESFLTKIGECKDENNEDTQSSNQMQQIMNETKKLYNLYHVVLERSHLENWNSAYELEDLDDEQSFENFTIVSNKPLTKVSCKPPARSVSNLHVCELELWSNLVESNSKQIANSMSKSVGSITDQYLSSSNQFKHQNKIEISLSPEALSETNTAVLTSPVSTNSEGSKKQEETKCLTKLNDSGYMTVPPLATSRLGSSSNEEDEENPSPPTFNSNECQILSSPALQLENQLLFYQRVERAFFNELEKSKSSKSLSPISSSTSPNITRRSRSTSLEQTYFDSIKIKSQIYETDRINTVYLSTEKLNKDVNINKSVVASESEIKETNMINSDVCFILKNDEQEENISLNDILSTVLNEIINEIELSSNYVFNNHDDKEENEKMNLTDKISIEKTIEKEEKEKELNDIKKTNHSTNVNNINNEINISTTDGFNCIYDKNYEKNSTCLAAIDRYNFSLTSTSSSFYSSSSSSNTSNNIKKNNKNEKNTTLNQFRLKKRNRLTPSNKYSKKSLSQQTQRQHNMKNISLENGQQHIDIIQSSFSNILNRDNSSSLDSKQNMLLSKKKKLKLSTSHCHQQTDTKKSQHDLIFIPRTINKERVVSLHSNDYDISAEDEFFLAISSSRLETGSCPEFFWYPATSTSGIESPNPINHNSYKYTSKLSLANNTNKRRRTKSMNDMSISTSTKSYENITHTNYVQMVNSMITGAISDVADLDYVEYVKRHLQGLFDNFSPVLMKSRSNEEMAINSPSRDQILQLLGQTIPKSFSFDLKFLEDNKLDPMDFSKFGLGIKETSGTNFDANRNSSTFNSSNKMNSIESDLLISENLPQTIEEFNELVMDVVYSQQINSSEGEDDEAEEMFDESTLIQPLSSAREENYFLDSAIQTTINTSMSSSSYKNMEKNCHLISDDNIKNITSISTDNNINNDFLINENEPPIQLHLNNDEINNRTINSVSDDATTVIMKLNRTRDESFSTIVQSNVTMTTDDDDIENNLSITLLANLSVNNNTTINNSSSNNSSTLVASDPRIVLLTANSYSILETNFNNSKNNNSINEIKEDFASPSIDIKEKEESTLLNDQSEAINRVFSSSSSNSMTSTSCLSNEENSLNKTVNEAMDLDEIKEMQTSSSSSNENNENKNIINEEAVKSSVLTAINDEDYFNMDDLVGNSSSYIIDTFENHFKEILDYDDLNNTNSVSVNLVEAVTTNMNEEKAAVISQEIVGQRQRCSSLHDKEQPVESINTNEMESVNDMYIISNSSTISSTSSVTTESVLLPTIYTNNNNNNIATTITSSPSPLSTSPSSNLDKSKQSNQMKLDGKEDLDLDNKFFVSSSSLSTSDEELTSELDLNLINREIIDEIVTKIEYTQLSMLNTKDSTNIEINNHKTDNNQTQNIIDNDSEMEDEIIKGKENNPSPDEVQNHSVDPLDDLEIECKVDYFMKADTDDGSFTSSTSSSSTSLVDNSSRNERESDYDNMTSDENMFTAKYESDELVVDAKYTVSMCLAADSTEKEEKTQNVTSSQEMPSVDPTNEIKLASSSFSSLDRFVAFNDLMSKSNSDEEDDDFVHFNFVDDFTDLNRELDENWIQEDELIFGGLTSTLTSNNSNDHGKLSSIMNQMNQMFKPRLLHRIDEESSVSSEIEFASKNEEHNYETNNQLQQSQERIDLVSNRDEIVVSEKEDTLVESNVADAVIEEDITSSSSSSSDDPTADEDEDKQQESTSSSQNKEKLRTKQCDIDSLLGGVACTYDDQITKEDEDQLALSVRDDERSSVNVEYDENNSNATEYSEKNSTHELDNDFTEEFDETNAVQRQQNIATISSKATEKDIVESLQFQNSENCLNVAFDVNVNVNYIGLENEIDLNRNFTKFTKNNSQTEAATENDASDFESDEYIINQTLTVTQRKSTGEEETEEETFATRPSLTYEISGNNSIKLEPDEKLAKDLQLKPDKQILKTKLVRLKEETDKNIPILIVSNEESNNQIEELTYPNNTDDLFLEEPDEDGEQDNSQIHTSEPEESKSASISHTLIETLETLVTQSASEVKQEKLNDSLLTEFSSNENFEVIYECQVENDEETRRNSNHLANEIKKSESEIDIANLKLNLSVETGEDTSNSTKLKEVISDIEKEIDSTEQLQANLAIRPTTLALTLTNNSSNNEYYNYENDNEVEEEDLYTETEVKKKRLPESTSWPIIASKNSYDLNDDKSLHTTSITYDRINEAEQIYIGLPTIHMNREQTIEKADYSRLDSFSSSEIASTVVTNSKIDKSYQVNLPRQMIDTETQMTPPVSPPSAKTNNPENQKPKSSTKVNAATETDETEIFISNIQISNEEELLMKKLIEKENLLRSTSISTQTPSLEELVNQMKSSKKMLDEENVKLDEHDTEHTVSVANEVNSCEEEESEEDEEDDDDENELNDQQCLSLLQDMKKMDDDLKMELNKISNEDANKNELFSLIKNYSHLDQQERSKLESLITSNLKNNKAQPVDLSKDSKISKNISLDNYLKSLVEDPKQLLRIEEPDDKITSLSEDSEKNLAKKESNHSMTSSSSPASSSASVSSSSSVNSSSSSLSNRSEPLLVVDMNHKNKQSNKLKNKKQMVETIAQTDSSSIKDSATTPPESNISMNTSNHNNYNSHFIDLLSLNLERSKTWVEMTEAKLNYMIGETDAVLKSMCFESSDEEKIKKSPEERGQADQNSQSSDSSCSSSSSPKEMNVNMDRGSSFVNEQRGIYTSSSSSTNHIKQSQQTNSSTNIQEMTKLYLDNYKRQLQESKNELNSKINLLDKEKEKVCRIRDIKKRELYMRRQAAIEAFRLERERELNAQISKIDELRGAIDECKTENNKIKSNLNYENIKDIHEFLKLENITDDTMEIHGSKSKRLSKEHYLPSQNREKLAKLRRNLVLNSSLNNNNNNSSNISDLFNSTINNNNNNNNNNTISHYCDDYLNNTQSLNNTPRSLNNSCFSTTDNNYRYNKASSNDLNKENHQMNQRTPALNSYQYFERYNKNNCDQSNNCLLKTAEVSSSSFIYKPTLTSSPNYVTASSSTLNSYNKHISNGSQSNFNSNYIQHNSNGLYNNNNNNLNNPMMSSPVTNPVMVMIPLRNRSFSSTPVTNNFLYEDKSSSQYNGYQTTIPIEQVKTNVNSIPLTIERSRSTDTRLLIPVISTNTITTTTTLTNTTTINTTGLTNVKSISANNTKLNESNMSNGGGCSTSIVDESRLLLKEYEQLRNDSVSEIQRAHDSLNAR